MLSISQTQNSNLRSLPLHRMRARLTALFETRSPVAVSSEAGPASSSINSLEGGSAIREAFCGNKPAFERKFD